MTDLTWNDWLALNWVEKRDWKAKRAAQFNKHTHRTEINQKEYHILKNSLTLATYIVREESGLLLMFDERPDKYEGDGIWGSTHPDEDDRYLVAKDVNLFPFIQWLDQEPYEIAELIKPYEKHQGFKVGDKVYVNHPFFFDTTKTYTIAAFRGRTKVILEESAYAAYIGTLTLAKESEETQMKNLNWFENEIKKLTTHEIIEARSQSVIKLLKQLDVTPLDADWITEKRANYHENVKDTIRSQGDLVHTDYTVEIIDNIFSDVETLLVPKQNDAPTDKEASSAQEESIHIEKPEVPQYVAKYIESARRLGVISIMEATRQAIASKDESVGAWANVNRDAYSIAFKYGYTVKEPRYVVVLAGKTDTDHKYVGLDTNDDGDIIIKGVQSKN